MRDGFFSAAQWDSVNLPPSKLPKCGACALYKTCNSPKMEPTGDGRKRILIIGEAPGRTEDDEGRQFCGESGRLLEEKLSMFGINMRKDCWLENAIRCRS
jgi:uracil-DNA glycosylase